MPNTRQWALLIWLVAALFYVLRYEKIRKSFGGVVRAFFGLWKPVGLLVLYVAGWVWLAYALGIWEPALLTDTLFWLVGPAVWALMNTSDVAKDDDYIKATLKRAIQWTLVTEFVAGLFPFSIVIELLLVPALFLLGGAAALAATKAEYASVKPVVEGMLAVGGLWIVGYSVLKLATGWDSIDGVLQVRTFALPVWLTIVTLPYMAGVGVYTTFESLFKRIALFGDGNKAGGRSAKLALLSLPQVSLADLNSSFFLWVREASSAKTCRQARRAIRAGLARQAEKRLEEQNAKQRLVDMAGVDGTNEYGERLDQREFEETKKSLRWLHTSQMGWYRQRGRYRDDLLPMLTPTFQSYGLSADHGIALSVSADGQAWFAWRRTITGWCFAIGASEAPPSQWMYDGPGPPPGFPGQDPQWGAPFGADSDNW